MSANAMRAWGLLSLSILVLGPRADEPSSVERADVPWEQVLGPPAGEWPEPQLEVIWRTDLNAAFDEALESGRPLCVTARCLPCKQCAAMDEAVLAGGPELTPLLARFVTVRVTDASLLDLGRFPVEGYQDLDVSWWVWFLSPDAEVYGVFGGRDEVSDATRVSKAAFVQTLRRVLDHHGDPRRVGWNVDGPAPTEVEPRSARDLPGHAAWLARTPDAQGQGCLHCHQVAEILRQPAIDAGTFDKERDLAVWPYPENVGLEVDRDDGLRVVRVVAGSPADVAGIEVGDELAMAGGRRLFGQADLRAALHRGARPAGPIELAWKRGQDVRLGRLDLEPGWRETVLDWRMSVSQGNVGAGPGFFPLRAKRASGGSMAVEPFFGRGQSTSPAFAAGLRPGHVIVAVDDERRDLSGRAFLVWFRRRYEPGDEVELTVLNGDERRTLTYRVGP